ncbi:MAG: thioredoxin family protein [Candidatus Micrarchaeia archaeon]|jgi:thiol-disulfide isomerase/thioredoxin
MICIVALVVFAVLGIFSAYYRSLALEAFDCVFRRITLRPCKSGLDTRVKAKVVAKSLGAHPALGRFVNAHFEALSWALTILMLASTYFVAVGAYNLYVFGSCDPANPEGCPFSTAATASAGSLPECSVSADGSLRIDYFYSESCPYSANQTPILEQFASENPGVRIVRHCVQVHDGDDALCSAKYGNLQFVQDSALAQKIGLKRTPTLFFNCGSRLEGVQSAETLGIAAGVARRG